MRSFKPIFLIKFCKSVIVGDFLGKRFSFSLRLQNLANNIKWEDSINRSLRKKKGENKRLPKL